MLEDALSARTSRTPSRSRSWNRGSGLGGRVISIADRPRPRAGRRGRRSAYVVDVSTGESSKVANGSHAEWLDDDTLIVVPGSSSD
jgi:hypothetical protein